MGGFATEMPAYFDYPYLGLGYSAVTPWIRHRAVIDPDGIAFFPVPQNTVYLLLSSGRGANRYFMALLYPGLQAVWICCQPVTAHTV